MVKKIKNEINKQKETKSKITQSNKDEKDKIINKETKKDDSFIHKNIKQRREFAKHKPNEKIYKKILEKKLDKNSKKEELQPKKKEKIKQKVGQKDLYLKDEKSDISKVEMEEEEDDDEDNLNEKEHEKIEEENSEKEDIEENEEEQEQSKERVKEQNNKGEDEEEENEEEEEGEEEKEGEEEREEKEEKEKEDEEEHKDINLLKNSISEHYYTFQYPNDLYTLLYTSLIFKWIDTTKIIILCNTPKEGYKIDIFLRQFNFNTIYLDKEMPLNTNNHFYSQFLKNIYQICIINLEYSEKSKNFPKEILNETKVPLTIIYFDCFSQPLLEYHSFHPNARAIYHFISNKDNFLDAYENLDENINFNEFIFDKEQVEHLRYRAEDMLNGIRKSDIKKEKMRKINIELLHSKKMQKFFKENPKERENIIRNIEENTIKNFSPSVSFLPSYLIHSENNAIADAIKKEYKDNKKNKNKRRKKQKKMEQYFEALDKGDGSQNLIKF